LFESQSRNQVTKRRDHGT